MVGLQKTLTRGLGLLSLVAAGYQQPPQAWTLTDAQLVRFWGPCSEPRDRHLPAFVAVGSGHHLCLSVFCR